MGLGSSRGRLGGAEGNFTGGGGDDDGGSFGGGGGGRVDVVTGIGDMTYITL